MKQTIKAGQLTMCVDSMGAEIISLKKGDKDIIWWGDAEYWGEHCPTLFPCIGGNSRGVLRLGGKEYNLKKHGFAKGMEFTLEEATEHSLTYSLAHGGNPAGLPLRLPLLHHLRAGGRHAARDMARAQ